MELKKNIWPKGGASLAPPWIRQWNYPENPFFLFFDSPVLIDAVVAAQTTPGQDAMMEFLDFNEENGITLPERYLLAAAFSTHPSYKLLNDLLVCED